MIKSLSVVVTGANRGIGLSLTEHYRNLGSEVYAVCRQASPELADLGVNVIEGLDLCDEESVAGLAATLSSDSIDLLINNAGILRDETFGQIDFSSINTQFQTNAIGTLRLTESLSPRLGKGSKIAMITSRMGSVADNTSGGRYGYRMSKAALNIASVSLARDLAPRGIAVGIIHPGLVGTDMIRGRGNLTPNQAAELIAQRIAELDLGNTDSFWHSSGEILPW